MKTKGGMYELVMVIVFLLIGGMLWAILGFGMNEIGTKIKTTIPNTTVFNQTPVEDVKNVMDWPQTAFYIYLFFVAIVSIIWAVKKTQVGEYE